MNKLPDCPRCEEDELWTLDLVGSNIPDQLYVRCFVCNYHGYLNHKTGVFKTCDGIGFLKKKAKDELG